jgi:hypothetical protein
MVRSQLADGHALRTVFATVFKLYVNETSRDAPDVIAVDMTGISEQELAKTIAVMMHGLMRLNHDRAIMCAFM